MAKPRQLGALTRPDSHEKRCAACKICIIDKGARYCTGCQRLNRKLNTLKEKIKKAGAASEEVQVPEWAALKGMIGKCDAGLPDHERGFHLLQELIASIAPSMRSNPVQATRTADQGAPDRWASSSKYSQLPAWHDLSPPNADYSDHSPCAPRVFKLALLVTQHGSTPSKVLRHQRCSLDTHASRLIVGFSGLQQGPSSTGHIVSTREQLAMQKAPHQHVS